MHWDKGWLCKLFPSQGFSELTPALQDAFSPCKVETEKIVGFSKPFSCNHTVPEEDRLLFSTQIIQG